MMVEMCLAEVELLEGWTKDLAHLAGHAGLEASAELDQSVAELKQIRRRLDRTAEEIESAPSFPDSTVTAL